MALECKEHRSNSLHMHMYINSRLCQAFYLCRAVAVWPVGPWKKLLNMARSTTQEFTFILELSNFCRTVIPSLNHSERMRLVQNHPQNPSLTWLQHCGLAVYFCCFPWKVGGFLLFFKILFIHKSAECKSPRQVKFVFFRNETLITLILNKTYKFFVRNNN